MDICVLIRKVGTVSPPSPSSNFDAIDTITGCREFRLNRNYGERDALQGEISIRMYTLMR